MLKPHLGTYHTALPVIGSWAPYDYLLGDANPQLAPATCLYFDGISPQCDLAKTLDLAQEWFGRFGSRPKVVLVRGDKQFLSNRYSMRTLRESVVDPHVMRAIETVEIYPKGRTTVDDAWRPSIYFTRSISASESAFFCINAVLGEQSVSQMLLEGHGVFKSCAAYGFLFPAWFSPLGYKTGISVEPSYRALGKWRERESRRLSHWRDNSMIGIRQGCERRLYRACDGYVRDAYPLMLLDACHLARKVGDGTLADLMPSLGHVSAVDGKVLWRIHNDNLALAQQLLDAADITLSGRRIEI